MKQCHALVSSYSKKIINDKVKGELGNSAIFATNIIEITVEQIFHYNDPCVYYNTDYIADTLGIGNTSIFKCLKALETLNIIKRGVKYEVGKEDGIKRKKIWITIVDKEIIKLFHLEKICEKPSGIEQQEIKQEQQQEFYENVNDATLSGNYHEVCESFDNNKQLTKNIAYIYNEARKKATGIYMDWDSKNFGKLTKFIKANIPDSNQNSFNYRILQNIFKSCGTDKLKWNTNYLVASIEKALEAPKQDIPPSMSFSELYEAIKGIKLHRLENEIAC